MYKTKDSRLKHAGMTEAGHAGMTEAGHAGMTEVDMRELWAG